ncbi:hypothetical protein [Nonomuraea sp. NEAU-A123]|uniref:hypothetical protein n=1 Tax=Nonomuraea sp. NEAU-A123 TaxID=2839649 RepID=UPI001BE4AE26|nr:hypothetical protein [Nonomuraea sp. NEAU-A123]MBT2228151.1 hypothetical protein [Nonomuraea sp. NEAU-A123]
MNGAGDDEPLDRLVHVLFGDRLTFRDARLADDLAGEGVDQPRLPLAGVEGALYRVRGELLAGGVGVLAVQLGHLLEGKVRRPHRLGKDVERRGADQP